MLREFPLGPRVADHATAFAGGMAAKPANPQRASTVVLVRDGMQGPDVYLMRRTRSMAFAASMHVFPGGGVDPRDCDVDLPWSGPAPRRWAAVLGVDPADAAGLVCAAVRELFEECGVLLAGPAPDALVSELAGPSWEADRLALIDRQLAMSEVLQRRGLVLRSDLLRAWSRWCTPVFEPRRYDTWFFVAVLPALQQARHVGGEADSADWVPAGQAAVGGADGRLAMMPPTLVALEEVAAAPDVTALLATPRSLGLVVPWLAWTPAGLSIRVDLDGRGGGAPGPGTGLEDAR